jgi:hypothetical protein
MNTEKDKRQTHAEIIEEILNESPNLRKYYKYPDELENEQSNEN